MEKNLPAQKLRQTQDGIETKGVIKNHLSETLEEKLIKHSLKEEKIILFTIVPTIILLSIALFLLLLLL